MGFSAVLGAVGVGLQAFGMAKSVHAAKEASQASQAEIAANMQAEEARKQQMNLDAARRRREDIRQSIQAGSQALSNATAQGAELGSGLAGGYGQISGRTGTSITGINEAQGIGNRIFAAHMAAGQAGIQEAYWRGQMGFGNAMSSLGGAIITNERPLMDIVNTFSRRMFV